MRGQRTQWYIGAPNGIVLCVDERCFGEFRGRFFHSYSEEAEEFSGNTEMILKIDGLFNELRFPFPSMNERSFAPPAETAAYFNEPERERVMSDDKLLQKHGDIGTFIIRVQHRQNSSWQGRLTWMEEDKTVQFRSTWEMVKLIESAMDTVSVPEEDGEEVPAWDGD